MKTSHVEIAPHREPTLISPPLRIRWRETLTKHRSTWAHLAYLKKVRTCLCSAVLDLVRANAPVVSRARAVVNRTREGKGPFAARGMRTNRRWASCVVVIAGAVAGATKVDVGIFAAQWALRFFCSWKQRQACCRQRRVVQHPLCGAVVVPIQATHNMRLLYCTALTLHGPDRTDGSSRVNSIALRGHASFMMPR